MNQHYHTSLEDLLVKYLLQEADPEEIQTVGQWLDADPANRHYFDQVRLIWEKSQLLALPDIDGEEETAWLKFRDKLHEPREKLHEPREALRRPVQHSATVGPLRWAAIAAIFLLLALLPFLWWQHTSVQWETLGSQELVKTDTLPDGSIVTLNKNTTLSLPEKFKTREITLKGEAFFRIAADKNRPFHVTTNGITITVLGTSFNVRSTSGNTGILVETGRISVSNKHRRIELDAGETLTLGENDRTLTKTQPSAADMLYKYYQPRVFECHDIPLSQFIDAVNKAYDDSVVIANPALRNTHISCSFHGENLEVMLNILSKTLGLEVERSGSKFILK